MDRRQPEYGTEEIPKQGDRRLARTGQHALSS
jgi:hypothetical protein